MTNSLREKLGKVYRQHYLEVLKYVGARVDGNISAEDIVQDAFLKLYASLQGGKTIANPQAWLKTVSRNLLIDHHRAQSPLALSLAANSAIDPWHSDQHGPEDCLRGIVANLPYKYKKAVYLVDIKGIRQVEAARQLAVSLPTFKSHVQRGRKLVKQGYVECCDYTINQQGKLEGEVKNWEDCKVCSSAS